MVASRVSELVEILGVSDMTVRRDIEALAEQGLVRKVHGGATSRRRAQRGRARLPGQVRDATRSRSRRSPAPPRRLIDARRLDRDLGRARPPTRWPSELRDVADLTVVTNSPRVAELLHDRLARRPDRDPHRRRPHPVRRPGRTGRGRRAAHACTSTRSFLGVHGIDERAGLTTPNLVEAETNRALIAAARRVRRGRRPQQVGHRRPVDHRHPRPGRRPGHRRGLDATARRTVSQQVGQLVIAPAPATPAAPAADSRRPAGHGPSRTAPPGTPTRSGRTGPDLRTA